MDELINLVAQRTGLAPDKARTAVETVLTFVKGRLPDTMASQLDAVVAGGAEGGPLKDATSKLGGMTSGLTDVIGGGGQGDA